MNIHVAVSGNDAGPGTAAAPLASLTEVKNRLRALAQSGQSDALPIVVWLHGGTHHVDGGLHVVAGDIPDVPVSFRALPGEIVRVSGGRQIPPEAFAPVVDAAVLARLDPLARGNVVCCALAACGIESLGAMASHGFAFPSQPADPELFINDRPMPVARWPKSGALLTTTVPDQGTKIGESPMRGATFTCDDGRVARWATARHAVCHGQWGHDWAPSTVPVVSVDPRGGAIVLGAPSIYGVRAGKRFVMMHLLEEIGEPGEWYVDRDAGILYLWPPQALAGSRIEMSALTSPLISVRGVRQISFHDLIIECARGTGVILDGSNNRLVGCELRNIGGAAVTVGGEDNGVIGCHVHDCGQGGIFLGGGDRRTLTPGGNFAVNNHIHDFNRIVRTYRPGIKFDGVGQRASRNLIHAAPHFGLYLHGNDHVIENNEICDVCLDTDDAGAFYMGRNPSERGSVLRGNFFHHVGTGRDGGTSAIYIDDGAGGVLIEDNVFFRTGNRGTLGMGAICINSGKDTTIERNIFCECPRAVGVLLTTQEGWERAMSDLDPGDNDMFAQYRGHIYRDVDIRLPPYSTRYPELARLKQDASRNRIAHNLIDRCDEFVLGLEVQDAVNNRIVDADPGYRDALHLDFSLPGHAPMSSMGLDAATYRFAIPDLRRRLDCKVTLNGRPQQDSLIGEAHGQLVLSLVNRSQHVVRTQVEVFASPVPLSVDTASSVAVELAAGASCSQTFSYRVRPEQRHELFLCAREVRRDAPAVFVQADVQVHHRLPRCTTADAQTVAALAPLTFRNEAGQVVASMRLAMLHAELLLQMQVEDPRAAAGTAPWRTHSDVWQGPMFGIFLDRPACDCVRQLVFFPTGQPNDEVWYLRGPERTPTPAFAWQAQSRPGGYDLTARIPLAALDLDPGMDPSAVEFRLQAMVQIPGAGILPLFGSVTSYNNSRRFALCHVDG